MIPLSLFASKETLKLNGKFLFGERRFGKEFERILDTEKLGLLSLIKVIMYGQCLC